MKKALGVFLSLIVIGTVFAGCSGEEETETTSTTVANTIVTEEAVIKESDAINFIRTAYTEEELGLSEVKDEYSFMVAGSGVEIDGEKYIKVAANVMSQSDVTTDDGQPTFNFEAVGEYYISFDGEKILMKDMKSGEYKTLDNKYDEYKSKGETTQEDTTESTEKE